jgi:hypothetical protein
MALTPAEKEHAALQLQEILTPMAFGKKRVPPLIRIGNATGNGTYWVDIIQNGEVNQKEIAETLLAKHAQDHMFANANLEPLPDVDSIIKQNNENKAIHSKQYVEPPRPSIPVVNSTPSNVNHSTEHEKVKKGHADIVDEMTKVMNGLDHSSGLYKKLAPILNSNDSPYKKCQAMEELGKKIEKSPIAKALMKVGVQKETRNESKEAYDLMNKIKNPADFFKAVEFKAAQVHKADSPRANGYR